jgi:hypothetical protein
VKHSPGCLEAIAARRGQRRELSFAARVSVKDLEFSMQAVVDRMKRVFTLKQPISDEEAEAVRKEAMEFAIALLAKYKSRLAHRTLGAAAER